MSIRAVTSSALVRNLKHAIKVKQPVFVHGTMGIGKSSIVRQIAKDLDREFIDIRLSQVDQTDLRGIPYFNPETKRMDYGIPSELPTDPNSTAIIFLDEMNQASPAVSAAAYQLILDRRIGQYVLPKGVVIIAAGNKASDAGVNFKMPAPLANRFIHFELVINYDDWRDWAIEHRIHPSIIGYLEVNQHELYTFSPKSPDEKAFATPRTWEFVSNVLEDEEGNDSLMTDMVSAAIGEGLALKFIAHRNLTYALPKPQDILAGNEIDIPLNTDDSGAKYSLIMSTAFMLKEAYEKKDAEFENKADNFVAYMMQGENFSQEFVVMGVRTAMKNFKINFPSKSKGWTMFSEKYAKVLNKIFQK